MPKNFPTNNKKLEYIADVKKLNPPQERPKKLAKFLLKLLQNCSTKFHFTGAKQPANYKSFKQKI